MNLEKKIKYLSFGYDDKAIKIVDDKMLYRYSPKEEYRYLTTTSEKKYNGL